MRLALRCKPTLLLVMAGLYVACSDSGHSNCRYDNMARRELCLFYFYDVSVIGHVLTSCVKGGREGGREMPRARTICLHTHTYSS